MTAAECHVVDLGRVRYAAAAELQSRLVAARQAGVVPDLLLLCEHFPVITLGRNGRREHLLATDSVLRQMGVDFHPTNRGGDITFHGPGQLVAYPILNLAQLRRDVVWYVRQLEEVMIRLSGDFGVHAQRIAGWTGIWVLEPDREPRKLGAIGVHLSRWVTSHGLAYNVSTDLRYFDLIVPCGLAGSKATSLEALLGRTVEFATVVQRAVEHFGAVFQFAMRQMSRAALEERLQALVPVAEAGSSGTGAPNPRGSQA
jgi:lipoyl(octanoyl) transferase